MGSEMCIRDSMRPVRISGPFCTVSALAGRTYRVQSNRHRAARHLCASVAPQGLRTTLDLAHIVDDALEELVRAVAGIQTNCMLVHTPHTH